MDKTIAVIILTFNEELHIKRCIHSIYEYADEIFVIDSFSQDKTVDIATSMGAKVFQNPFINHAIQFNWALNNCSIKSNWIWRIDADEYVDKTLILNLQKELPHLSDEITGVYVRRGIKFMGKLLKYGTWAPRWTLKIFRKDAGLVENRWMDEHIILNYGNTIEIEGCQIDENLNDLTWWTNKHNHYATREMLDVLSTQYGFGTKNEVISNLLGTAEQKKRWMKLRYAKAPLFVRPFFNFFYRYFFRLGFLDGFQGFIWHVLQGFWYRFLVDAKIFELKTKFSYDQKAIKNHVKILRKG